MGRLVLMTYLDPLPTNCVATPVCPAIGRGYPKYSLSKDGEYGYFNLAVFMGAVNLTAYSVRIMNIRFGYHMGK